MSEAELASKVIGADVIPRLRGQVARHPYPLVFATISGAHLYGFPSADSDFDLRGTHILPLPEIVGLNSAGETIEQTTVDGGLEIDLVTHDVKKLFGLILKKNGYVMEQVLSPLVIHTTPEHEELKAIAAECLTKHHAHHYLGFADTQWKLFRQENPPRVKPLLYVFRVLLTGIHLMRTGRIEANIQRLCDPAKLPYLPELVERKRTGKEKEVLEQVDSDFYTREFTRLRDELQTSYESSTLPDTPRGLPALHDLLVRIRLRS